jgi:hypothetical protein
MDINNWDLYYKIHETENRPTTTQMVYEPRINKERNVFCMNFCYPCEYQLKQPRLSYTQELVDYLFEREVKYLEIFKDEPFCPEILDIQDKQIYFKFYDKTCNESVYRDNDLKSSWKQDITDVVLRQVSMGYLKATVYPHSHFYDSHGQMRSLDFYATIEKSRPYLNYKILEGIVGFDTNRFSLAREGDELNIELIFKSGLTQYSKWPENLQSIHDSIYNDKKGLVL